jgi:hypothetical protein
MREIKRVLYTAIVLITVVPALPFLTLGIFCVNGLDDLDDREDITEW